MKFIIRWVINAVALYAAIYIVNGILPGSIELQNTGADQWIDIIVLALIFGLLNALLRPLLMILTCPLIILTLGLGTLLINTLLFFLTGWIGAQFGRGFTIDGFLPAFLGALVVTLISIALNLVLRDAEKK